MNAGAVARLAAVTSLVAALGLLSACSDDAVPIPTATPSATDQGPCRNLLSALPDHVADQPARTVEPDHAWGAAWGDPPIVLTCGVAAPDGFRRTSSCTTVDGVDWFIPEKQLEASAPRELTMTTVNRAQYVQVRMPADYWPPATTLADVSTVIRSVVQKTGACT